MIWTGSDRKRIKHSTQIDTARYGTVYIRIRIPFMYTIHCSTVYEQETKEQVFQSNVLLLYTFRYICYGFSYYKQHASVAS